MNLEGSRKFIAMLLGLIGTWVLAKYGPSWGGIFNSGVAIAAPMIGASLYMLVNYLQKSTADTFVPENWLAGKRTFIGLILAILAPVIASTSAEAQDSINQSITLVADLAVPGIFMLFQTLSDKKMAAVPEVKVIAQQSYTQSTTIPELPAIAIPSVPEAPAYKPVDLDAYVVAAKHSIAPGEPTPDTLGLAYKFYAPILVTFDLREVPREYRVSESKRMLGKALELFTAGYLWYTKLPAPPTSAQASNVTAYMATLKKDYEKANNVPCSNKTFDELKSVVRFFADLYEASDGVGKLEGKTIDWSIFGGSEYTPLMLGWNYAKLI